MGETLATNPSSSNPSVVYRIIRGADGVIYCDCPGWKMRKTCKHLVAYGVNSGPAPTLAVQPKAPKQKKQSGLSIGVEVDKRTFDSDEFQSLGWYQGCGTVVEGNMPKMMESLATYESEGKYVAEPKLDGIWIAAFSNGNSVRFWSRNCLEKQYGLANSVLPPGTILIGELGFVQDHPG